MGSKKITPTGLVAQATEQPYLGKALLASEGDASIKVEVKNAHPNQKSDCLAAGSGSPIQR